MAQFSDTGTEKAGLIQAIDFGLFGSSTENITEYPLADKTRNINKWYRIVMGWIFEYAGNWSFDDSNYTNLPYSRANCVLGQDDYTFPDDYVEIEGISYKDANGIWHKLIPLDRKEIGVGITPGAISGQISGVGAQDHEEFLKTNGTPIYYDKFGNHFRMYPSADRTSTDGDSLRVYHTRDAARTGTTSATGGPFLTTDTTKAPGFNRLWHPVLAEGAIYEYARANGIADKAQSALLETERFRTMIQTHYATRKRDEKVRIIPRYQNNR